MWREWQEGAPVTPPDIIRNIIEKVVEKEMETELEVMEQEIANRVPSTPVDATPPPSQEPDMHKTYEEPQKRSLIQHLITVRS